MADLAFIGVMAAFLAVCALYVRACDRVIASSDDDAQGAGR
jgi:hypothetical protein